MKIETAVYKVEPVCDDPRFDGFGVDAFPESFPRRRKTRKWRVIRFARWWKKPLEARGRVRSFNDYPNANLIHPVFSPRAVDVLRDLLEPNGEILPLSSPVGTYYHFNITKVADVLNWKKSELSWNPKPITASSIYRYNFSPTKLKGLTIFRLPEKPAGVYVTEPFLRRVREHGLNGFVFLKVWPLPPETDLWKFHKEEKKRQKPKGIPAGKTIKGNMVIFHLKLDGDKPNAAEKKAISSIEDRLDELLIEKSQALPIGNLEGHDFKAGKCRMVLSCPDANALEKKLAPLLKKLDWASGFTVKKHRTPYEELQDWWD